MEASLLVTPGYLLPNRLPYSFPFLQGGILPSEETVHMHSTVHIFRLSLPNVSHLKGYFPQKVFPSSMSGLGWVAKYQSIPHRCVAIFLFSLMSQDTHSLQITDLQTLTKK